MIVEIFNITYKKCKNLLQVFTAFRYGFHRDKRWGFCCCSGRKLSVINFELKVEVKIKSLKSQYLCSLGNFETIHMLFQLSAIEVTGFNCCRSSLRWHNNKNNIELTSISTFTWLIENQLTTNRTGTCAPANDRRYLRGKFGNEREVALEINLQSNVSNWRIEVHQIVVSLSVTISIEVNSDCFDGQIGKIVKKL